MTMFNDVAAFHEKFQLPRRVAGLPISDELKLFRLSFLLEELQELSAAFNKEDLPEVLDALVDLVYVALGTAWLFNLPFEAAWGEVHKANMRKVPVTSASFSKRGSILDIGKPKDWVQPNIAQYLASEDKMQIDQSKPKKQLDLEDFLKANQPKNGGVL